MACTESHVVAPMRIGIKSERQRKWISGVFHDQEWERWEAIVCLVFHEKIMYSQITDKAISFQTMLSPDVRNGPNAPAERSSGGLPTHMLSTRSPAKSSPKGKGSACPPPPTRYSAPIKTLLAYNDSIPVYDVRKTVINWDADLGRLGEVLSLFPGEVPVGSFTVVRYTVSSYMAAFSGGSDRVAHIGCNILWVIVCGTPSISSRS
ncbi:hypothetical protein B0H14DRAFT_3453194 [Mycena olivaceomarginata]|nr:hypothetical protein B0H14DRAFT_3453194 [Mycena olivaceomarginata]